MTLEEYWKKYPDKNILRCHYYKNKDESAVIDEGMLQFDEDTGCNLAGPYTGNYAYYAIIDGRVLAGRKLLTIDEENKRLRFSTYWLPFRLKFGEPAKNEEHLQTRLALLTNKERKERERILERHRIDVPTVENPFMLHIAGNDDSTWTKFLPSYEEAVKELNLLESLQPLCWHLTIHTNNFVFTN